MSISPFDDLLEEDEVIVWSAQAQHQKGATVATGFFWVTGVAALVGAVWLTQELPSYAPSATSIGILAPLFMVGYGLFSIWLALTGKGLLPPPTYAVSTRQAFIAESKTDGGVRRSWFLLDRGKPGKCGGAGSRCFCRIPVVSDSWFGRSAISFSNLNASDAETLTQALTTTNKFSGPRK